MSEADLHQEKEWFNEKLARQCLEALKKHNIPGYYAPDRKNALTQIIKLIPEGIPIGVGDSVTLHQVGVIEGLEKRGNHQIFDPFRKDGKDYVPPTVDEFIEIGLKALSTQLFLTGLNALTLDGKLVNTDATGNRVSGLIFGPPKVIAVAGINKIVADVEAAQERIRTVAAPINAYRHQVKHGLEAPPCGITGECVDCRHARRLCCYTVIVDYQRRPRIEVVIVGEELGI